MHKCHPDSTALPYAEYFFIRIFRWKSYKGQWNISNTNLILTFFQLLIKNLLFYRKNTLNRVISTDQLWGTIFVFTDNSVYFSAIHILYSCNMYIINKTNRKSYWFVGNKNNNKVIWELISNCLFFYILNSVRFVWKDVLPNSQKHFDTQVNLEWNQIHDHNRNPSKKGATTGSATDCNYLREYNKHK